MDLVKKAWVLPQLTTIVTESGTSVGYPEAATYTS